MVVLQTQKKITYACSNLQYSSIIEIEYTELYVLHQDVNCLATTIFYRHTF